MMRFYMFRAASIAGVYEEFWTDMWKPLKRMITQNLSTWEEDNVRQRSDCHAWGSVPIYEYCAELAGVTPLAAGFSKLLFKPRLGLSPGLTARIALGKDNIATVSWRMSGGNGAKEVTLQLEKAIAVASQLPGGDLVEHGMTKVLKLVLPGRLVPIE
jgi:hypothetical protein